MKAVVLCAGEGTRMRPFTYSKPKHLLPLANKPLIKWILESIKETTIDEIAIVTSPGAKDAFRAHLGDGIDPAMRLTYIVQKEPKGLAHAVQCAEAFAKSDPFLLYLGDNLFEHGVKELVNRFDKEDPTAAITLVRVDDARQFGVALLEKDEIVKLIEKPADPPSNWAVAGAYVFKPEIFAAIRRIKPSARGELEITDAIQMLIDGGHRIVHHKVTGWWKDVGEPRDAIVANELLLGKLISHNEGQIDAETLIDGIVAIEKGAHIRTSRLIGPALIGEGALIENSQIGPGVTIGENVSTSNSTIKHSVVLQEAVIRDVPGILRSLIGKQSAISQASHHEGHTFLLGDCCSVSLTRGDRG